MPAFACGFDNGLTHVKTKCRQTACYLGAEQATLPPTRDCKRAGNRNKTVCMAEGKMLLLRLFGCLSAVAVFRENAPDGSTTQ